MIRISHRGNLTGPNKELENRPDYVANALKEGFDVEVDVWFHNDKFWLGHEEPKYVVEQLFISQPNLWLHCKDVHTLFIMRIMDIGNYFFHQNDDVVLTSQRYLWTYPGKQITSRSIAVCPERVPTWDISGALGVCSDYIATKEIA